MPYFQANGVRWHYLDQGGGGEAGAPVVLVHGWPASARFWLNVAPALASTRRVISVDLKGFGQSDRPGDGRYSIHDLADGLAQLVSGLAGGPADVIGHSMGGMVSYSLAIRRPDLVRRLVAVSAPCHGPTAVNPLLIAGAVPVIRFLVFPLMRSQWLVGLVSRLFTHGHPIPPEVIEDVGLPTYHAAYRAQLSMRTLDLCDGLAQIRAPTCLVYGEADRVITPSQPLMALARIPGARLVVFPDCGHCPSIEGPERFLALVSAFLAVDATL